MRQALLSQDFLGINHEVTTHSVMTAWVVHVFAKRKRPCLPSIAQSSLSVTPLHHHDRESLWKAPLIHKILIIMTTFQAYINLSHATSDL